MELLGLRRGFNRFRIGYFVLNTSSLGAVLYFGSNLSVLFAVIYAAATVSFYILQGSNPGFVEQECLIEAANDLQIYAPSPNSNGGEASAAHPISAYSERDVCERCQLDTPLRSHHCRLCNRCVHRFDHHCGVIGTCIGERNHCRFLWALLLHMYILAFGLQLLWDETDEIAQLFKAVFSLIMIPLFILSGMHVWLAIMNTTSYEFTKNALEIDFVPKVQLHRIWNMPYVGKYAGNLYTFCCLQDSITQQCCMYDLGHRRNPTTRRCNVKKELYPWQSVGWEPFRRAVAEDVEVTDDICNNRYYSCC